MSTISAWISAFRLRTLPLAIAGIVLGGFIAAQHHAFNLPIFLVATWTAIVLQILSNLANDYGDFEKGTDNDQRIGPTRALQSGAISQIAMKKALFICSILALFSGIFLLYVSFGVDKLGYALLFFAIGMAAIWAAIKYTVGKNAYGYQGLGDVFVFLFFGWVSVMGTYFLMTQVIELSVLFPASVIGLLSAGVLNLNNTRDLENDSASGKFTLATRLGEIGAKRYQLWLFIGSLVGASAYDLWFAQAKYWGILGLIPAVIVVIKTFQADTLKDLDPLLKIQALGTFLFSIIYGISLLP